MRTPLTLLAAVALAACADRDEPSGIVRDTLPGGGVRVVHGNLPSPDAVADPRVVDVHIDLSIGAMDGDEAYIFGDVRGVQAASDGTVYVLDYQAREVRAFSPEGQYLRTTVRAGEGPGEVREANGIVLAGDTLLWVNDHGAWVVVGVDPEGREVARFPKPVLSYGYIWDGAFDERGRYWRQTSHSDSDQWMEPEPGPQTDLYRIYLKSYNLSSAKIDSVFLGEEQYRGLMVEVPRGQIFPNIPFRDERVVRVQPSGGFWSARTGSYRLTRLSEEGDTVVVIEAAVPAAPVTDEDRTSYLRSMTDVDPEYERAGREALALAPDVKPVLEDFFVDRAGQLWVWRTVPADAPPFIDVFSPDGDHLGSLRLGFRPAWRVLDVRGGAIHTWVRGELDVPTVVRAPFELPGL